jgi:hypothetical protein
MSWKCPHCGFETGLAPLTFKDPTEGVATCPRCDRALPAGTTGDSVDKSLRWMEQEHPVLFDYLMEKKDRRAARGRTVRRVSVLVAVGLLALFVYLMVW